MGEQLSDIDAGPAMVLPASTSSNRSEKAVDLGSRLILLFAIALATFAGFVFPDLLFMWAVMKVKRKWNNEAKIVIIVT